jgi:hypothetical protein
MAFVADEQDVASGFNLAFSLTVDFADERTGGIKPIKPAFSGDLRHGFWHAMGRENNRCAIGHLIKFFNEHSAFGLQAINNEAIVHNLMAHIHWRTVPIDRTFDDFDRTVYAGAKAAWSSDKEANWGRLGRCVWQAVVHPVALSSKRACLPLPKANVMGRGGPNDSLLLPTPNYQG